MHGKMAYLIDTNIFVACLRGRAPHVLDRFLLHHPSEILVPFQVVAELYLGAAKSARPQHHAAQVEAILKPFAVAWPDQAAITQYVNIRATLEKGGNSISQPDLWIAAITLAHRGTLVTHNTGEFARVPGLALENWIDP
jgi:tRNA(fMet)-specific endonuclease VapC